MEGESIRDKVLDYNEGNAELLRKRDDADTGPQRGYK